MCALAVELDGAASRKPAERALKSKEPEHREAAARALVHLAGKDRPRVLAELLEHEKVRVRCAAVEAAGAAAAAESAAAGGDAAGGEGGGESGGRAGGEQGGEPGGTSGGKRVKPASKTGGDHDQGGEAATDATHLEVAAALIDALAGTDCPDVLARRIADARADLVRAVCAAPVDAPPPAHARAVRMLGRVAALERGAVAGADAVAALEELRPRADAAVRAAIADALGRIGTDAALELATGAARGDESARVRRAAFRAVARRRSVAESPELLALALDLAGDADAGLREDAAVALGAKIPASAGSTGKGEGGAGDTGGAAPANGPEAAVDALVGLLRDPAWEVAVVAAVSLGKTRAPDALAPLADLAGESEDWKMRGAAVVGLGHLYLKEAIPHVIAALEDEDPVVRRTALEVLVSIAGRRLDPDVDAWTAWWTENERRLVLFDPDEEAARRDRYGYERSAREIYAGLDVLVLESRGDHIQNVLAGLGIEHRLTTPGRVDEDAPHARAVFFSNCTGEVSAEDVDRLAWFVRAGGYLAGSCWALTETIGRAVPGVVAKLETRDEVLDDVPAAPCAPDSPYLEGVFPPDVTPVYALKGAHLIDVLDPERCEVLVDSPACHDRWGGGDLAVWFPAGHGVVLDSVNHFEEQGLARATWLKKPEERQAYAVDHLGLGYAELRATADERWWRKATEAAEEVQDLSVFRLISNFVRRKRIAGDG
jgi:HEAT repeat protein